MLRSILITEIAVMLLFPNWGACNNGKEMRDMLLNSNTIQMDTSFPYYKNRSDESIASEVELNGYKGVYLIICGEKDVSKGFIKCLHKKGIPIAAQFFASSVYTPNDVLPEGWQKWKMEFTSDELKTFKFLSYVHDDYREWMKKRIVRILGEYDFDGFTFAEVMYPIYDGLSHKPVLYGDVSKAFQEHFKKATGNKDFPDFVNPENPDYYRKNMKLYNDLVKYRTKTINDFYGEVVNGKGGIREKFPDIIVVSQTLAVNIPDGPEKITEWEGGDIASMMQAVKPDIHFLQTHAPDWLNPALPCDYSKFYRPYLERIRSADKNVKIGLQADIGSFTTMRKDPNWINGFYKACADEKIDTTTSYELSIRWEVYECAPSLKKAVCQKNRAIKLYFDKRIAEGNGALFKGRTIAGINGNKYVVTSAKVDGNILAIELDRSPAAGSDISIPLEGIFDDPAIRYVTSDLPQGKLNKIPAGTTQVIQLN